MAGKNQSLQFILEETSNNGISSFCTYLAILRGERAVSWENLFCEGMTVQITAHIAPSNQATNHIILEITTIAIIPNGMMKIIMYKN